MRRTGTYDRRTTNLFLCLCTVGLFTPAAWTQAHPDRFQCVRPAPDNTITTDRPAFTNASTAVPCLSLQLENGLLESSLTGQHALDLPETLIRFGMTDTTEFRLTVPDYFQKQDTGTSLSTGLGDSAVGLKQQVGPLRGFDLSVIVYLSLPTGGRAVSSHGYDPAVQIPWSRKLSRNWTLAGMLSTYGTTQADGRNVTGQTSLLFDRQLTAPWDAFVEYNGSFPERGGPQHILHFGTAYKLSARQQVDVHGGVGFAGFPADQIIGVGYSVRFDLRGSAGKAN